jgi:hypothetical protein
MGEIGQKLPSNIDPVSSHSAGSSMRAGIFTIQGLRETLVDAITSQLAEPIDKEWISLTRVPGCAASRLRSPANLLST